MSGLFFVGSRFGAMPKGMKVNGVRSFVSRTLTVATARCAVNTDSRRSNFVPRQVRTSCSSRHFGTGSLNLSSIKANVDDNNVLSSPFPDVRGFTGIYVHEAIYSNLDKWHDKTALVRNPSNADLRTDASQTLFYEDKNNDFFL